MLAPSTDLLQITSPQDIVTVRRVVREHAIAIGFSLVEQTKLVTAASELARNTLLHGNGATMRLDGVPNGTPHGLRPTFEDQGPGIADIGLAMRDGYTSGTGLGLGLSGSRRLCQEFAITSTPGVGTRVVIARWK